MQVIDRGPRDGSPIVLIHCFTCAIDWWDGMLPPLERDHRVVAIDLLGHGGSEKPGSGYSIPDQAELVAEALRGSGTRRRGRRPLAGRLRLRRAGRAAPELVDRVAIIDMPPDNSYGDLGFIAGLAFQPVIGEALWTDQARLLRSGTASRSPSRLASTSPTPSSTTSSRMTYTAYDESPAESEDFIGEESLDRAHARDRQAAAGDHGRRGADRRRPRRALAAYADGARRRDRPDRRRRPLAQRRETGRDRPLVLAFAESPSRA